ncbi:MAG TPA: metal-dependent hydrolase [Sphingomicrobium sp.]
MPMTTTHALLPIAVAVAAARRPLPWRLVIAAAIAAAAPDVDGLFKRLLAVPPHSIYGHRGVTHSLFAALVAGLVAAALHQILRVRALTAGLVVGAAMASHGILDMMTDGGQGVAYFWPFSSTRWFADWRWIHSTPVHRAQLFRDVQVRLGLELWQLIIPMFAVSLVIRSTRAILPRFARA